MPVEISSEIGQTRPARIKRIAQTPSEIGHL